MPASALYEAAVLIATLTLMAGGFCVMFQQKRWAGRFLFGGVVLAVGAALLPDLSHLSDGTPVVPWQWTLAFLAIIFAVLRQWGLAAILTTPLLYSMVVWPVVSTLPIVLAIVAVAFLAIGAVTRLLNALVGAEVTGHVVGTYLVRLIDGVFALPFLLARGRIPRNPPLH